MPSILRPFLNLIFSFVTQTVTTPRQQKVGGISHFFLQSVNHSTTFTRPQGKLKIWSTSYPISSHHPFLGAFLGASYIFQFQELRIDNTSQA
jgi:hypothetical protein